MAQRLYKALILCDYAHAPFAEWVKTGYKTLETRMKQFSHRGDLVICCGNGNSVGDNRGNALCIVNLWHARGMRNNTEEEIAARIAYHPLRRVHLLKEWRHFSRDFKFVPQRVNGVFQSIFTIAIPDDVEIIARPDIMPWAEPAEATLFTV